MKENLKITLVQSHLFWEDIDRNLDHLYLLVSKIKKTDILFLPEMFNTSFSPGSIHLSESMEGKTLQWMKNLAKEKQCSLVGTLMIKENKKIFNRLVWVFKDGTVKHYNKKHLFSLAKENKFLSKGDKRLIVKQDGWKFCPLICYDLRFPVFSRNNINYDVLVYLSNWPKKRIVAWESLLKARSIENQCYTIGVNRVGLDKNKTSFLGRSLVFDAFGENIFLAQDNKEQVKTIMLKKSFLTSQRKEMDFLRDQDRFIIQE